MKKIYLLTLFMPIALFTAAQTTLSKPVALPATSITNTGFNANWKAVDGTEAYCVYAYDLRQAATSGLTTIVDEDFAGVTQGSVISPVVSEEAYVDLSDYGYATTFGWSAYGYPSFITGMVGGVVYSPYLDLRGDEGRYQIVVTSYCSDGDSIFITTHGSKGEMLHKVVAHIDNGGTGMSTDTLTLDDGSRDLFFTVVNNSAKSGTPDYIDRVQVLQNLKSGTTYYNMVAADEAVMAKDESTGAEVTTKHFAVPKRYTSSKELYYDLYASKNDYSKPSGHMPYTAVYSPYSDMVKVDLVNKSSEVLTAPAADSLEVGQYAATLAGTASSKVYDGSYFSVAPTTFYLKHTGSQIIYTAADLAKAAGKEITTIKFIFNNQSLYTAYPRKVNVKMKEIGESTFTYDSDKKDYCFFNDDDAQTVLSNYAFNEDFSGYYGTDGELVLHLSKPFAYSGSKNLLVSITFDGDEACESAFDLSFYYVPKTTGKAMTFTNDNVTFADYQQTDDWPLAGLNTGTRLEQPITQLVFRSSSTPTGIVTVNQQPSATAHTPAYNLAGQRVNDSYKGIVIKNHKKVIVK